MMNKAWLWFPLLFSGCDKAWDTTNLDTDRAGLEAPAPDCDCKAKARNDEPSERVDVSKLDLVNAPSRGSANAKVTLVAYCDFECPFCKKAMKTVDELAAAYPEELRIVFKQRPLPFHQHADLAAKAALAAHKQGKFWQFQSAMFSTRTQLDQAELERLAETVGLDLDRFRALLTSPEVDLALERDLAEAERVGAKGTPTFILDGKRIPGAQPYEVFATAIDEALAKK